MAQNRRKDHLLRAAYVAAAAAMILVGIRQEAQAKKPIRDGFQAAFPSAEGTVLVSVPSQADHCGVCHFDFTGGGTKNPFGESLDQALSGFPSTLEGRRDAALSIQFEDPDGDGFTTFTEVTDVFSYPNTPTFPGLTPALVGSVSAVNLADIQDHLVPLSGGDTTPPDVTVITPNGGETLTANHSTTVEWIADDASGISGVNLYLSLDQQDPYSLVAEGLPDSGSYTWFPANRPTAQALFLVEAIDHAFRFRSSIPH